MKIEVSEIFILMFMIRKKTHMFKTTRKLFLSWNWQRCYHVLVSEICRLHNAKDVCIYGEIVHNMHGTNAYVIHHARETACVACCASSCISSINTNIEFEKQHIYISIDILEPSRFSALSKCGHYWGFQKYFMKSGENMRKRTP